MELGLADLDLFWSRLLSTCNQLEWHYNTDNLGLAEQLLLRAEDCFSVLRTILGRLENSESPRSRAVTNDIPFLIGILQSHIEHYREWTLREESDHHILPRSTCAVNRSGERGRPSYTLNVPKASYQISIVIWWGGANKNHVRAIFSDTPNF